MEWYYYFGSFWAGMFLANFVPHFVKGICGDPFPTPFAKPPGKGLSSPIVNVVWSLFNLVIGFILFKVSKITIDNNLSIIVFFVGIALMSMMLAKHFVNKDKA